MAGPEPVAVDEPVPPGEDPTVTKPPNGKERTTSRWLGSSAIASGDCPQRNTEEAAASLICLTALIDLRQHFLLTTFNIGAAGLNLHHCYRCLVILQSVPNLNLLWQAVGLIHCLVQAKPQEVFIIHNMQTGDRFLAGWFGRRWVYSS